MKHSHAIYWYLFWGNSIESLNEKVDESYRAKDFEQVKFYCKIIALKVSGITLDDFCDKYVKINL